MTRVGRNVIGAVAALGAVAGLGGLGAGCGKFEDPNIVIDLRPLAVVADPPEQLVAIDPTKPPDPSMIQLAPIKVCALIADPGAQRKLDYVMIACPGGAGERCLTTEPTALVGGGTIDDPEDAATPQPACAQLDPSLDLFKVIKQTVLDDPLAGFSAVDIMVSLEVYPDGGTPDEAVWAAKGVRFGSTQPAGRTPNHNPTLTEIDATPGATSAKAPLALGRCHDQATPLVVAPGEDVVLLPVEPPGARETYLVPTFDGGSEQITENLKYQWLAGAGSFSKGSTGGPKDAFGNDPALDTTWTAPDAKVVGAGLDVRLYVVQRDERYGEAWYESCIRVQP